MHPSDEVRSLTGGALPYFFADDILDCVMEAFGEIVDPLTLFHEIAKRAVDLLAISIARYRLRRPYRRRLCFLGHVATSPRLSKFACSLSADAALAEYDRWTALD